MKYYYIFMFGMLAGLAVAYSPISRFVQKDALREKRLVLLDGYYKQYSAVRQFKK